MTHQAPSSQAAGSSVQASLRQESRNVTLLSRQWEWLDQQPHSVSGMLRQWIDEARRDRDGAYRVQASKETCYRFMREMAGNRAHFEEAIRALFAGNAAVLQEKIAHWPADIREEIRILSAPIWASVSEAESRS